MININTDYCNAVNSVTESQVRQDIESIVSSNDLVEYCTAYVWKNRVLVGLISKPLFSRTQRTQLEESIKQAILNEYGFEEALISFDMDVIYEISKLNKTSNADDKDVAALFYSVKVRRS